MKEVRQNSSDILKGEKLLKKQDNEDQVRRPIHGKERAWLVILESYFFATLILVINAVKT